VTAVRGDRALQLLAWGRPANVAAHHEAVEALAGALTVNEALRAVERTTDAYIDRRLGFEMRLASSWTVADRTPPELAPIGTFTRWEDRGRWIGVLAVALDDERRDDEVIMSMVEQSLRDEIAGLSRATPSEMGATLAGMPARRVAWHATMHHIDALLLPTAGVGYALIVLDGGSAGVDEAARHFALLPSAP
jgi:hypothetical protein